LNPDLCNEKQAVKLLKLIVRYCYLEQASQLIFVLDMIDYVSEKQ
jgi:hypothetical protein